MNFVIILAILIAFLLLVFPLLHLLASLSELRKGMDTLGNRLLLIGSSLATLSLILYFFLPIVALFLWLIGCGLSCYGAYWNDKQKGDFKKSHHIIRITFAIVLTLILLFSNTKPILSKKKDGFYVSIKSILLLFLKNSFLNKKLMCYFYS